MELLTSQTFGDQETSLSNFYTHVSDLRICSTNDMHYSIAENFDGGKS